MNQRLQESNQHLEETNQRLQNLETKQEAIAADAAPLKEVTPAVKVIEARQEDFMADFTSILEDPKISLLLNNDAVQRHKERKDARATAVSQRTFDITEILEVILLNLPMRDLLLTQRVSRGFHSVIQGSLKIRQALYLEPVKACEADGKSIAPVVNPLLYRPHKLQQGANKSALVVFAEDGHPSIVRVRGLFTPDTARKTHNDESSSTVKDYLVEVEALGIIERSAFGIAEVDAQTPCYAKGSWQRMLASQPPCVVRCFKAPPSIVQRTLYWETVSGKIGDIWYKKSYAETDPKTILEYMKMSPRSMVQYGYDLGTDSTQDIGRTPLNVTGK